MAVAALVVAACNDDGDGAADKPAAIARVGDVEIYRAKGESLSDAIEGEWLRQEGAKRGLRPPADLDARLTEFPAQLGEAAARRADLTIPDADVAAYYRRHRSSLRKPEERWWRAVLSDTKARAGAAKRALAGGATWEQVAGRYNDPASGSLPLDSLSTPGTNDRVIDKAVFSARRGELVGPIATRAGLWVLEVNRIVPRVEYSLRASRAAIVPVLETRRKEQAQIDYWRSLRLESRRRTVCLAGPKVPECSNGPRASFDADGTVVRRSNPQLTLPPPPSGDGQP